MTRTGVEELAAVAPEAAYAGQLTRSFAAAVSPASQAPALAGATQPPARPSAPPQLPRQLTGKTVRQHQTHWPGPGKPARCSARPVIRCCELPGNAGEGDAGGTA